MPETVIIEARESIGPDGELYSQPLGVHVPGCTVSPASQQGVSSHDVIDGDTTRLQVLAPPGSDFRLGDVLLIRGRRHEVIHVPWDWSYQRRPWNPHHRMVAQVICERTVT